MLNPLRDSYAGLRLHCSMFQVFAALEVLRRHPAIVKGQQARSRQVSATRNFYMTQLRSKLTIRAIGKLFRISEGRVAQITAPLPYRQWTMAGECFNRKAFEQYCSEYRLVNGSFRRIRTQDQ